MDQRSERYVEHHLFRLWQYAMINRHGLVVDGATPCLWLPREEWLRQRDYFDRVGKSTAVDLLVFERHDERNQLWERAQRFVPAENTQECAARLAQRIPAELRAGGVEQRIVPGLAIAQSAEADLLTLGRYFDVTADEDAMLEATQTRT